MRVCDPRFVRVRRSNSPFKTARPRAGERSGAGEWHRPEGDGRRRGEGCLRWVGRSASRGDADGGEERGREVLERHAARLRAGRRPALPQHGVARADDPVVQPDLDTARLAVGQAQDRRREQRVERLGGIGGQGHDDRGPLDADHVARLRGDALLADLHVGDRGDHAVMRLPEPLGAGGRRRAGALEAVGGGVGKRRLLGHDTSADAWGCL